MQPEAAAPAGTPEATDDAAGQCARLARELHDFSRQVEQEDYLPQFGLTTPLQAHLITLAERLLVNPPVVTRETDDLYTVLKNTAHFYRVLGKDNLRLLKMILEREGDRIEEMAARLYLWFTAEGCQEELLPFSPPLAGIYDYAGFFLNTLGGRAYLFRRDARTRLLVTYYAVLIVDRANGLGINRHGIDIGPIIPQLIQEIESSNHLRDKEGYLERLYRLQESLPHPTGGAP